MSNEKRPLSAHTFRFYMATAYTLQDAVVVLILVDEDRRLDGTHRFASCPVHDPSAIEVVEVRSQGAQTSYRHGEQPTRRRKRRTEEYDRGNQWRLFVRVGLHQPIEFIENCTHQRGVLHR